jgi:hypothetical protein
LFQITVVAALALCTLAAPMSDRQSYSQSISGHVISQAPILTYAQEPVLTYAQAPLALDHATIEAEHYVCILTPRLKQMKLSPWSSILRGTLTLGQEITQ